MRVVRGLAAILCGSLVGLAACSDGGDDPVVLPTGTTQPITTPTLTESSQVPSSTSEPTPTTTLLLLPDEHVPEVDAFVRGFFDAYNAAQDSGNFAAFDSMYLPQCTGCLQMRDELEGWLADDGVVKGVDWVVQQQISLPFVDDYDASVIAYRQAGTRLDGSGVETLLVDQLVPQVFNLIVPMSPPLAISSLAYGPA